MARAKQTARRSTNKPTCNPKWLRDVEAVGGAHALRVDGALLTFDWHLVKRHSELMAELGDVTHKRDADGLCIVAQELPAGVDKALVQVWLYLVYAMPLVGDSFHRAPLLPVMFDKFTGDIMEALPAFMALCDFMKMTDAFMGWLQRVVHDDIALMWENRLGDRITLANITRFKVEFGECALAYGVVDEWSGEDFVIELAFTDAAACIDTLASDVFDMLGGKARQLRAVARWWSFDDLRDGFAVFAAGTVADVDVSELYAGMQGDADLLGRTHRAMRPNDEAACSDTQWSASYNGDYSLDWLPPLVQHDDLE